MTGPYRERLSVPLRWWAQGVMFIATVFIAVFLWVPGVLAWTIIGTIVLLFALAMQSYGSAAIEVRDGWLYAGKAKIQTTYLGSAQSLTAEEAWQIAGPKADARAYLLLRPYLRRAVKVELNDPADRTPYWLLASRHPDALAAALAAEIISD
ncbi:DUF3093 domain-containing protein [Nocardioides baekrokdamisoli]|nr:DUF3093 domain-containing protein [Nocardioides baekrokdamisoli]